jgi:fermentation-respiration switch protein FrsA (DUF1100 family)
MIIAYRGFSSSEG